MQNNKHTILLLIPRHIHCRFIQLVIVNMKMIVTTTIDNELMRMAARGITAKVASGNNGIDSLSYTNSRQQRTFISNHRI